MFEDFKSWIREDKFNISLSLSCAAISVLPAILGGVIKDCGGTDEKDTLSPDFWFSLSQLLVAMIGLFIVSLRYKPLAMLEISDKSALQDYIEEECKLKQTQNNNSKTAYHVVRNIVWQFYAAWIVIWVIWMLYYGVEMYLGTNDTFNTESIAIANINSIVFLLDFLSSSALFAVYIILNSITVNISSRSENHGANIYLSVVGICILFVFCLVLHVSYLSHPYGDFERFELYISIILSAFGCISFVLVLGKLNSNFLNIPRVFMFILYVYAVAQAYSFFYQRIPAIKQDSEFQSIIEVMKHIYPWVIFLGKITLLITLSWILNKKRLIFYIVNKSLSLTLVKGQLKEFNRYME